MNISKTQLLHDALPMLFVVETYVPEKSKQTDLELETKQPKADTGRGWLVNISKPPVKTMNEIINQPTNALRKMVSNS